MEHRSILSKSTSQRIDAPDCMRDCAGRAENGRAERRDLLNALETDGLEHSRHGLRVRPPPIGRIAIQLRMRIEGYGWPSEAYHVNDGLEHEHARSHRRNSFKDEQRILHVVEDAEQQYNIKLSDPRRREVRNVNANVLNSRTERFPRQIETGFPVAGSPAKAVPRIVVAGHDPAGASAFRLKRKIPIPCAYIKN
ncbi:MAG: hypothetical protein U0Q11_04600 [Vicinamibacterales bacterium]